MHISKIRKETEVAGRKQKLSQDQDSKVGSYHGNLKDKIRDQIPDISNVYIYAHTRACNNWIRCAI